MQMVKNEIGKFAKKHKEGLPHHVQRPSDPAARQQ